MLGDQNQQNYGQLGAGIGQLFSSMFGGNPGDAAQNYYNQAKQDLPQYFQPWMQAGQQALPQWLQQLQQLTQNPGQFINKVGQGYKQSPGYQFQLNQGLQGANNAAAAGGMAGSPQSQQYGADIAGNLANKDYYNYLSTALGQYGQGLSGLEHLSGQGQTASIGLGEDLSSILGNQAQAAYLGQSQQNQGMGGGIGSLIGGLAGLFF